MSRYRSLGLFALGLIALVACGERRSGGAEEIVRDSAGIEVVTLRDTPDQDQRILTLDPSWPADRDLSFGELVDLEVMQDGRVALLDRLSSEITILDAAGRVETRFGRAGEGPGEMSSGPGLLSIASTDSSVVLPDLQLQRITEFSPEGTVLAVESTSEPGQAELVYALEWRRYAQGGLVARLLSDTEDRVVRMYGARRDTLYVQWVPNREARGLLGASLVWDTDAAGRVLATRSDAFDLRVWNAEQREPERIIRREHARQELSEEDVDHLEQVMIADGEALGVPAAERREMFAQMQLPPYAPAISAVHVSPSGEYWLQRALPVTSMGRGALRVGSVEDVGSAQWEVLSPEGRLQEVVVLPEEFAARRFADEWIYGIVEDDLGVQTIGRVAIGR